MAAEIATAYVRIRPNLTGFQAGVTAGVKEGLVGAQEEINAAARANVAAAQEQIRANQALAATYKEIALAAGVGSEEAAAAAKLAIDATISANTALGVSAEKTNAEIASIREAVVGTAATIQETAAKNVAATVTEIEANQKLAASYGEIAAAAKAGSAEQIAAARLAASASAAAGVGAGAGAAGAAGAAAGAAARGRAAAGAEEVGKVGAAAAESEGAVAGLTGGIGKLGVALGLAFGAKITFDFVKGLAEDAAAVQKSQEVIRTQFGESAKAVLDFSEKEGIALGIPAHQALDTSARFGILFKNLNIGPGLASTMTVNLERLAGSLSAIRGVDPSTALRSITLAMLGNTRSLKQLGVAVDPASVKIAAFKLGLISTTKDALTPAIRAQAIYALATAHLGDFMDQAKAHAGDLANVQRRLSAEWDKAKETLGAGLLPPLTKILGFFATLLPPALQATQTAFRDLATTIKQFVDFVKPALTPVAALVQKIIEPFQATSTAPKLVSLKKELDDLGKSAKATGEVDVAKKIAAIREEVAKIKPGAGPAAVAGIQDQLANLPIKTAKERVVVQKIRLQLEEVSGGKSVGGGFTAGIEKLKEEFKSLSPASKGAAIAIGGVIAVIAGFTLASLSPWIAIPLAVGALAVAFQHAYTHSAKFREIVGDVGDFIKGKVIPAIQELGKQAAPAFAQLSSTAATVFNDVKAIVKEAVAVISAVWSKFGGTISTIVKNDFGLAITEITNALKIIQGVVDLITGLITGDWSKAWGGLKEIVSSALNDVESVITTIANNIVAVVNGIWQAFEESILEAVKFVTDLLAKIPTSISTPFGTIGFKNPFKGWSDSLQATIDDIKDKKHAKEIADAVATNTAAALQAKTRDPTLAIAGQDLGKSVATNVKTGAASTTTGGGGGGGGGGDAAGAAAIQAAQQHLADLGTKLSGQVAKMNSDITAQVNKAKQNLVSIGGKLASAIGTALDAPIQAATVKLQTAQDKLSLVFDTNNAVLQRAVAKLSFSQAKIQFAFDQKSQKLDAASAKIALQQQRIGLATDKRALSDLLGEGGLPGGKSLSQDPKKAIAQLKEIAKHADAINRPAILDYITQIQNQALTVASDKISVKQGDLAAKQAKKLLPIQQALASLGLTQQQYDLVRSAKETPLTLAGERLRVAQDAVDKIKVGLTKDLTDLTTTFAKDGNLKKFTTGVHKVLTAPGVQAAFRKAGSLLGTSFIDELNSTTAGIFQQAVAISKSPHRAGGGQTSTIVRPLVTMAKDQAAIKKTQGEIGHAQTKLQTKIEAHTKKAAQTLAQIHSVQLGPTAKAVTKNPGGQSKTTRTHTNAGG